jgi:hypothetical protein
MGIGGEPIDPSQDGLCPLVYDIDESGDGLSSTIVDAVQALLRSIVFAVVSVQIEGDELGFVTEAVPFEAEAPEGTAAPGLADLVPAGGDGQLDSFTTVRAGTHLRFHLVLANGVIRSSDYDQIFFLRARIVADGATTLDETVIEVIVPARSPPGPPDAAADR